MSHDRFGRTQSFVGLLTLAITLLSALALGANRPVSWSLLTIAVTMLFSLQVLVTLARPAPLPVRRAFWPGLLAAVAIAWAILQVMSGAPDRLAHPVWQLVPEAPSYISADPGQGRHAVMRMCSYAMIFLILLWTAARLNAATTALRMIALFSTALALFGLYAFATGNNPILGEEAANGVVSASFINRNSYATYAIFGALANIACYLQTLNRQDDSLRRQLEHFFAGAWIFALGALICAAAVSLTQSRAGAGAGIIGLVVFLVAWRTGRSGKAHVMLAVVGGTLLYVGATSATGLLERLIATDAADGRFLVYPAIREAIMDRPLLGHGAGAFHDAFRPYLPTAAAAGEWDFAHSTWLELAFGLGLPAAGAFVLAQALIVGRLWKGARTRREHHVFACFGLGSAATAAFHSFFDFSLQMPSTAALFAAILAIAYSQSFSRGELASAEPTRARRHGT